MRIGLSRPKIRALKEIARAIVRGDLALATLGDIDADAAHAALTAVHGIGPWTADIYLLGCLGHADAWPAGDLALQEAARLAFGLKTRPTTKEMGPLAEPWRPWRAVAARVLWTYYRAVKGREGAPGGYATYLREIAARPAFHGDEAADREAFDAWVVRVLLAFERFRLLCAVREGEWGTRLGADFFQICGLRPVRGSRPG